MAIKTTLLAVLIMALIFKPSLAENFIECPNDPSDDTEVKDVVVKVDGVPSLTQTERVRIPDSGVFNKMISCIIATDKSGTGDKISKLEGGTGYSYVELEFTSMLNEGLDYEIQVYSTN